MSAAGHKVFFYPKFHCELNFIEYFWAQAKRFARQNCAYSLSGLRQTIPHALDSVSIETIRKLYMRTNRYMDAYRHGLRGKAAEFAVRQYKSHRRIPAGVLDELCSVVDDFVGL